MSENLPVIIGAHLVGSVNATDAESVFKLAAETCADVLHSLPDGETGERWHWMLFQGGAFEKTPGLVREGEEPIILNGFNVRPFIVEEGFDPADLRVAELGYARAAVESYALFRKLKEEGKLPEHLRFQVSLPSPLACLNAFIRHDWRPALEGPYEEALLRELAEIQAAIPASELCIQWDLATEFALIEAPQVRGFGEQRAWFDDVLGGAVERAARLGAHVAEGVTLGYHLCYGDLDEKHFVEPEDASILVQVANGLAAQVGRHIDFIHLPVPIERDDEAYFAPLADLRLQEGTDVYLGLLHREDGVAGAQRRIRAAGSVLPRFGVATECGMARSPREEIAQLFRQHREALTAAA